MTATVARTLSPTAFDAAYLAAVACGWPGRAAFDAVVVMKAAGMSDVEIEQAFIDAGKRLQ